MSLKKNISSNYVSQIYATTIGIVMVPMYVHYMGAEAYGLVGFFATMQAWFQLLDMGLTPTLAREAARYNGGAMDANSLRRLLRALESIFICIAIVGAAAIIAGSGFIAGNWLKVQHLPLSEVQDSIILAGAVVALRWICGIYRGAINGLEKIVWLSFFNMTIATARFVLVFPLLIFYGKSPVYFFAYQLLIALLELVILAAKTYRLLPRSKAEAWAPMQLSAVRSVLKFSISIAFTSSVWVLVTQTDKLILAKLLTLTDYGYFSLAVLMASGVLIVTGPISGALLPRLTKLSAEENETGLINLYRNATQLVSVIAVPAALVLAFFSEQVLWVWTGDAQISAKASAVLTLYALGNGVLAISAFPYYLQYAKGNLKLHLIGNVWLLIILIPALILATIRYGAIGAGYAWLGTNTVYFFIWIPIVHGRFVTGLHRNWMLHDVGAIAFPAVVATAIAFQLMSWPHSRVAVATTIVGISIAITIIAALGSGSARKLASDLWRRHFKQ